MRKILLLKGVLTLIILMGLIFPAMPMAMAEETTPTDPVVTEEAPAEAPAPDAAAEAPPADVAADAPVEVAPADAPVEPAPADAPVEEAAPAQDTSVEVPVAEVMADAAAADVVLANAEGEPLVAASAETAELLSSPAADPWFVAGGITYRYLPVGGDCSPYAAGTCFTSSTPIQAAINDPHAIAGTTINIEAGNYTDDVTIDKALNLVAIGGDAFANSFTLSADITSANVHAPNIFINPGAVIQDGIDLVNAGGTVNVAAGTYAGQVTINKSVDLIGAGEATTTILLPATRTGTVNQGGTLHDYLLAAYAPSGTIDVHVQGFTLDANGQNKQAGTARLDGVFMRDVKDAGGSPAGLFSSTVHNFAATEYESWGLAVYGDSLLTAYDDNFSDYTRDGIAVVGSGGIGNNPNVTIIANTVTGSALALNGINIGNGSTAAVSSNIVTGHTRSAPWAGGGIYVWGSDNVIVDNNQVNNNFYGIDLWQADASRVYHNTLINNIKRAISLDDANNNILTGNTITALLGSEDVAIGLSHGSTGNMIGGPTPVDGNTITMATSGFWATPSLLYSIWVDNTVGAGSNTIQGNTITGGKRGIQIDSGNTGTTTISNNIINNTPTGPEFPIFGIGINGGNVNITANTLNNTVRPIESFGANNLNIDGNTINGSTYSAINLGNYTGTATVSNNIIHGIDGNNGIWAQTSGTGLSITGNRIYDISGSGGGGRGIQINPAARNVNIEGNEIYNVSGFSGICIDTGATGARINNNFIHNNEQGVVANELTAQFNGNFIQNNRWGIDLNKTGATFVLRSNNIADNNLNPADSYNLGVWAGFADVRGNWWGSNDPAAVTGHIIGSSDFGPWLHTGTDIDPTAIGFQGDFTQLHTATNAGLNGVNGLQRAVNFAQPGATIWVEPGTYGSNHVICNPAHPTWCSENDNWAPALILYKDNLTINAVDPDPANTVIQSTHNFWSNGIAIQNAAEGQYPTATSGWAPNAAVVVANNATLDGFTFHRPNTCPGSINDCYYNTAGVFIGSKGSGYDDFLGRANGATVKNSIFSDVWHAVYIYRSSGNTIDNNQITATPTNHWAGISIYDGWTNLTSNTSQNNTISNNTINAGIFVGAWPGGTNNSGTVIDHNTATTLMLAYSNSADVQITNNTASGQIITNSSNLNNLTVSGNTVLPGAGNGIQLQNVVGGNIFDNTVTGRTSNGIAVLDARNVNLYGNDVENNSSAGITLVRLVGGDIYNNTILNNTGNAANPGGLSIREGSGSLNVFNNNIQGNTIGVFLNGSILSAVGAPLTPSTFTDNRIAGNTTGMNNASTIIINAKNNWWGCNTGPGGAGCDTVVGPADTSTWLVYGIYAAPTTILNHGKTSNLYGARMYSSDDPTYSAVGGLWWLPAPGAVVLDTPALGSFAGNVFTSAAGTGTAWFSAPSFDNAVPTTSVEIVPHLLGALDIAGGGAGGGGGVIPVTGLGAPIPVTGSGLMDTLCGSASTFSLGSGDLVSLTPDLCGYQANLGAQGVDGLPAALPEGDTLISGINANLVKDGAALDAMPEGTQIILSFVNPPAGAVILFWDAAANAWVEVPSTLSADGLLEVTTTTPGLYVMVTR